MLAAAEPRGVLWSVYAFMERLGFGFYLGGDAFAGAVAPRLPENLNVTTTPTFAMRGSLPWYNFLDSPTTWDRDDYRYFFDQMAKMRMNFVGFHSYDGEPFCTVSMGRQSLRRRAAAKTSLNYGCACALQ